MPRGGDQSGLPGYGDLKSRAGAGRGADAAQSDGGIGQTPDVGSDRANCCVTHWARKGINPGQGKTVRYRRWMPRSRRMIVATRHGVQAAPRSGGARMGCPREKVSMMRIAAPQCEQTKVA